MQIFYQQKFNKKGWSGVASGRKDSKGNGHYKSVSLGNAFVALFTVPR